MKLIKYGLAAALLLGMGSCVFLFAGLAGDSMKMAETSEELMRSAATDGMPDYEEWTRKSQVTPQQVEEIDQFVRNLGAPTGEVDFSCSASAQSDTSDRPDGRFASCEALIEYSGGKWDTKLVWSKEDDKWLLMGVFINRPATAAPPTN